MQPKLYIAAAVLVFAGTAQAQAAPPLIVQDEAAIHENAHGLRERGLLAARDLGATAVRLNMLQWRPVDPDAPFAVARAGLRPYLTVAGDMSYVRAVVRRYRSVVDTYSIWNEPDLGAWGCCRIPLVTLAGKGRPSSYRTHYQRAYRAVRRLDPRARVQIGELSPHGMGRDLGKPQARTPWFRKVLRRGRPLAASCVAVHPYYWFWSEPMDRRYRQVLVAWRERVRVWAKRNMLLTPRGGPVPVCSTEFGEPTQWRHPGQVRRGYRVCAAARLRACAQYMIFPSGQSWDTSLTDERCRPTVQYRQLRRAVRGVPASVPVPFRPCPDAAPFIETPAGPGPYDRYK